MEDKYIDLYKKLSKLQWLLQRHNMANHAENGPFADTTRGQGRVLAMLKMQLEISTKDLSYLLGIRIPSLNELLGKMEKRGYIERRPSEADKRVMIIHLTEKGKATEQERTDYSDIFDCLSDQEQVTFGEYLDRVIAALKAQIGDDWDDEKMADWMRAARSRMSDAQWEQIMTMRQRFGHHGHNHRGMPFCGGFDGFDHAPEETPEEDFDPEHDGPRSEGHRGSRDPRGARGPRRTEDRPDFEDHRHPEDYHVSDRGHHDSSRHRHSEDRPDSEDHRHPEDYHDSDRGHHDSENPQHLENHHGSKDHHNPEEDHHNSEDCHHDESVK